MDEAGVLDILQKVGAFRAGHFVGVSGLHLDTYVNKNAMYPYTREMSKLCLEIANRFKGRNIEAVVGPATGGIILSQWVAYHLSELEGREVYSVYSDKDADGFVIKRGYNELIKGKNILVVEDLVTTGGSLRKVIDVARTEGANIIAAVAICNRGAVTREMAGNPPEFMSMLTVELDQWPEGECDLCKRNIPINTDVGHGKDYLAKKAAGAA
ncbi:MAG: phosphoribosyltransferase [Candidatus Pacebacteria bacterium]|nr:phosphoribosyltransferase [Candidatus Paceibacterota bacterium]